MKFSWKKYQPFFKKIGIGGFIFFLVKGLIWLLLITGVVESCN